MSVTIYHNSRCGKSRATLALIRGSGIEPNIIEYLKTPLDAAALSALAAHLGQPLRALLRASEPLYAKLGLDDPTTSDAALLAAMVAHPILINRPIVVTKTGGKLCRPPELVLDLLPPSK